MGAMKVEAQPDATERGASSADGAVLEQLFRRFAPTLTDFFLRRTGNRDDAADLTQEAYARLAGHRNVGSIANLEAFLTRIALNLLKDRHRRGVTRHVGVHLPLEEELHTRSEADQERRVVAREQLELFQAAVERLPLKCRQVFVLHRFEEMTYAEIATRMQITVSAVEKHMMKAIARVHRDMGSD